MRGEILVAAASPEFAFAVDLHTTSTTTEYADPKGGAHGCAPFSDRAKDWRVGKSRRNQPPSVCSVEKGRFSLVTFF
jgi:hypothetical protein